MKKIYSILFFLVHFGVFSQMSESKEIQFETNSGFIEDRQIYSLKESGFLMVYAKSDYFNSNLDFVLSKYDSSFTLSWTNGFSPNSKYDYDKYYIDDDFYHVLFLEKETTNFGVLRISIKNGDSEFFEGHLLTKMEIQHFKVLKNKAFIGGEYNERPVLIAFNFHDLSSKVLQDIHLNNLVLNELEVKNTDDNLFVYLKDERSCKLIIKKYNYDGKLVESIKLGNSSLNIISSQILKTSTNQTFMVGSYSDICNEFSQGIYVLDMANPSEENIRFMPYTKLTNFYNYLPKKRKERTEARVKIRDELGRSNNQKFRIVLHEIYNFDNQNVLVGEIFYADYKSPSLSIPYMNGVRLGPNIYNSFRYTQAIICGLDGEGNIKWDNSFAIDNIESSNLDKKVQLNYLNNLYLLAYPNEGKINSLVMQENQIVREKEKFFIESNRKLNNLFDDSSNLLAWYDNNFLVWGKKMENFNEKFYIKKLSYDLNFNKN